MKHDSSSPDSPGKEVTPGCQFASDNVAGICPEVLDVLLSVNAGSCPSYGADEWTKKAPDRIREIFETDADTFFCFNGTAANSMTIAHLARSYHSVICH